MFLDAERFEDSVAGSDTFTERALRSFVTMLENRLGVLVVKDVRAMPFSRPALTGPMEIAKRLNAAGIVNSIRKHDRACDEPPLHVWAVLCNGFSKQRSMGATFQFNNECDAAYAALAEGLERYLWRHEDDYFVDPQIATVQAMRLKAPCVLPEEFAGFSSAQRENDPDLRLDPEVPYLWIQGTDLVTKKKINVPAQTVSGITNLRNRPASAVEPKIRNVITTGLATWTTQIGAQLRGLLEIIERDAYMIWWLNQIVLPRIDSAAIGDMHTEFARVIEICERYRLKIHVLKLPSDAPAHSVCVVLEDESGVAPRFSFGLKSHRSLGEAAIKATNEALRARKGYRMYFALGGVWDVHTNVNAIGHVDRMYYWGEERHAKELEKFVGGPIVVPVPEVWEHDSDEEHLARIVAWCKEKKYNCISVPLTHSKKNVIREWYIEMMVIPQLQPTHLFENMRALGGERLKSVPESIGYKPRSEPYADAPHPFS